MLQKIIVFSLLVLFLLSVHLFGGGSRKTILFMPFINEGSFVYDRLRTHIPNYLYEPVKNLPGYKAIPYSRFHEYMVAKGYEETDLKRQAVITSIAQDFNTDYIIHGTYSDRETVINIIFTIYKRIDDDLETHNDLESVTLQNLDAITLNTSFDSLIRICEKVTEQKLAPGYITLITRPVCSLLIDEEPAGQTPTRLPVFKGEHRIQLIYNNEELILDEKIEIKEGELYTRNIDILIPLTITSDEQCTVYINNEEKGETPFQRDLLWGREYCVEVIYQNSGTEKTTVFHDIINTTEPVSPIYLTSKGKISLDFPGSYEATINNHEFTPLPNTFDNLIPDTYRLRILLDDPEWKRKWLIYDKKSRLSPFSTLSFTRENLDYKRNWALMFIPSALQFYNREPVKGSIVLSLFIGSALCAGVSAFGWFYFEGEYEYLIDQYGEVGLPQAKVNEGNDYLFMIELCKLLTISGIIGASVSWMYSAADGIITNNHLYDIIYK
jgi:hypothetical protein